MDFLYQKLPKDLVYIIEGYAKDRTNYDILIHQLEHYIIDTTQQVYWNNDVKNSFCHEHDNINNNLLALQCIDCDCEYMQTFEDLKYVRPQCFLSHMETINEIVCNQLLFKVFLTQIYEYIGSLK